MLRICCMWLPIITTTTYRKHALTSPHTMSVMCYSHHAPGVSCVTATMLHGHHVLQPPCMWLSCITASMSYDCYALFFSQIKKLMLKQFQRLPRPHHTPPFLHIFRPFTAILYIIWWLSRCLSPTKMPTISDFSQIFTAKLALEVKARMLHFTSKAIKA